MMQKMGLDGGSWFAVATTEEETEGTPAQRCTNPHCPWTIAETNIKTKKTIMKSTNYLHIIKHDLKI